MLSVFCTVMFAVLKDFLMTVERTAESTLTFQKITP